MKQPKKLTRNQKKILDKNGFDPDIYMFCSEEGSTMTLWNKQKEVVETVTLKKRK